MCVDVHVCAYMHACVCVTACAYCCVLGAVVLRQHTMTQRFIVVASCHTSSCRLGDVYVCVFVRLCMYCMHVCVQSHACEHRVNIQVNLNVTQRLCVLVPLHVKMCVCLCVCIYLNACGRAFVIKWG